jgi:far upstream element-binding protein
MEAARYEIQALVASFQQRGPGGAGPSAGPSQGGHYMANQTVNMPIPMSQVGTIIGRGGETIRAIQANTGARVQISKAGDPSSPERDVIIQGNPQQIEAAKAEVTRLLSEKSGTGGSFVSYGGAQRPGAGGAAPAAYQDPYAAYGQQVG